MILDIDELKAHDIMKARRLVLCLPSDSLEAVSILMGESITDHAIVVNTHDFEKQEIIGIVHASGITRSTIDPTKSHGIKKIMWDIMTSYPEQHLLASPETSVHRIIEMIYVYKSSYVVIVKRRWSLSEPAYPVGIIDIWDIIEVIGQKLPPLLV